MKSYVIEVVDSKMDKFESKYAKLKKMCDRAKVDCSYKVLETYGKPFKGSNGKEVLIKTNKIEIVMGEIEDGNYVVIGTLTVNHNKNLVKVFREEYVKLIPKGVENRPPYCEHCNTNRRRKYLFLVLDKRASKVIQIGKACLGEYLPIDVDYMFGFMGNINVIMDEFRGYGGYSPIDMVNSFEVYMKIALSMYENSEDYISKNRVPYSMEEHRNLDELATSYKIQQKLLNGKMEEPTEEIYTKVDTVLKSWEEADYGSLERNVNTLYKDGLFKQRNEELVLFGLYKAYKKVVVKEDDDPLAGLNPLTVEYYGKVGEKFADVKATYISASQEFELPTYGYNDEPKMARVHTFKVGDALLVWMTSVKVNVPVGSKVILSGTIKGHNIYKGLKQTKVVRVKIKMDG